MCHTRTRDLQIAQLDVLRALGRAAGARARAAVHNMIRAIKNGHSISQITHLHNPKN